MAQEAMASNNYFMGLQKNSSFAMELNEECVLFMIVIHTEDILKIDFQIVLVPLVWFEGLLAEENES